MLSKGKVEGYRHSLFILPFFIYRRCKMALLNFLAPIAGALGAISKTQTGQSAINNISNGISNQAQQLSQNPYVQQQASYYNQQNAINQAYAQQQAAMLAQLQAQRQAAMQGLSSGIGDINNNYQSAVNSLNQQKQTAQPKFQSYRNQAAMDTAKAKAMTREQMASMGLTNSGENITANVALSGQQQNAMNAINSDEQGFYQDIASKIGALEKDKAKQINDINNEINRIASSSGAEDNNVITQLNSEKTKLLYDLENAKRAANERLQQFQYQKYMDQEELKQRQSQINYQKQQDDLDRQFKQLQFQEDMKRYGIDQGNWNKEFGLKQSQTNFNNNITNKELAMKQAQINANIQKAKTTAQTKAAADKKKQSEKQASMLRDAYEEVDYQMKSGNINQWLASYGPLLKKDLGESEYNALVVSIRQRQKEMQQGM